MTKKKSDVSEDCMPKCENCNAGNFETNDDLGECHLLPMEWVVISDSPTAMWSPCFRGGYCRHFERKTH